MGREEFSDSCEDRLAGVSKTADRCELNLRLTSSFHMRSTDISNPSWDQNFRQEISNDLIGKPADFKITLMKDEQTELGSANVPFTDVLKAPDMTLQSNFPIGDGATVLASICIRGMAAATLQELQLPDRSK